MPPLSPQSLTCAPTPLSGDYFFSRFPSLFIWQKTSQMVFLTHVQASSPMSLMLYVFFLECLLYMPILVARGGEIGKTGKAQSGPEATILTHSEPFGLVS